MDLLVAASAADTSGAAAPAAAAPSAAPPQAPESDAAGGTKNASGGLTATSLEEAAAAAYHRSLEGEDEPSSSPADANRSLVPTPGSAALTAVGLPAAGVDFGAGRVSRLASASAQTRVARRAADSGWSGGWSARARRGSGATERAAFTHRLKPTSLPNAG